ncbi:hypothetical protein [Planomonospora sp. ID82291]|uniref:hypothetical protein n=1 Tax=Planomonospora sp. ID82291 TaxID=2738136 RepID=UPI0018C3A0DC|nr:hypothetical protein [Planomonospora sp. ID82291]MBG0814170.1 hypothetical protein [Planomonospora sp. ID82291]
MSRIIPAKACPRCRTRLDGGPVLFHCITCRRAVYAADLPTETTVPVRRAA